MMVYGLQTISILIAYGRYKMAECEKSLKFDLEIGTRKPDTQ